MGPRPTRRVSVENPVGQGPRALPQGNGMIPREPPVGAAVLGGPRPRNRDFSLRCHCEERSDAAIRIPLFLICRDPRGETESSAPWLPLWGSCRRSRLRGKNANRSIIPFRSPYGPSQSPSVTALPEGEPSASGPLSSAGRVPAGTKSQRRTGGPPLGA